MEGPTCGRGRSRPSQDLRRVPRRDLRALRGAGGGHFGFTVDKSALYFLRDFGLPLFVFFIGLQVGPSFFSSFKSGGMVLNLLTVLQVFLSIVVTIGL